jgi:hypothetical protein
MSARGLDVLDAYGALHQHYGADLLDMAVVGDSTLRIRLWEEGELAEYTRSTDNKKKRKKGKNAAVVSHHDEDERLTRLRAFARAALENVRVGTGLPNVLDAAAVPAASAPPRPIKADQVVTNPPLRKDVLVQVAGSNCLMNLLAEPNIDATRTVSNDLFEVQRVLGIEAARLVICREVNATLTESDAAIGHRHLSLLADAMTSRGVVMSLDRHGVNRAPDVGPLARSAFEESMRMLVQAATLGEVDPLTGVSGSTMLGKLPPTGTGSVRGLMYDGELCVAPPLGPTDDNSLYALEEWL